MNQINFSFKEIFAPNITNRPESDLISGRLNPKHFLVDAHQIEAVEQSLDTIRQFIQQMWEQGHINSAGP